MRSVRSYQEKASLISHGLILVAPFPLFFFFFFISRRTVVFFRGTDAVQRSAPPPLHRHHSFLLPTFLPPSVALSHFAFIHVSLLMTRTTPSTLPRARRARSSTLWRISLGRSPGSDPLRFLLSLLSASERGAHQCTPAIDRSRDSFPSETLGSAKEGLSLPRQPLSHAARRGFGERHGMVAATSSLAATGGRRWMPGGMKSAMREA